MVTETKSTVYYCDVCGSKFLTKKDAENCEDCHKETASKTTPGEYDY